MTTGRQAREMAHFSTSADKPASVVGRHVLWGEALQAVPFDVRLTAPFRLRVPEALRGGWSLSSPRDETEADTTI
jgi:hypothetical protein